MKKERTAKEKYKRYENAKISFSVFETLFRTISYMLFGSYIALLFYDRDVALWVLIAALGCVIAALMFYSLTKHYEEKENQYRSAYIEAFLQQVIESKEGQENE